MSRKFDYKWGVLTLILIQVLIFCGICHFHKGRNVFQYGKNFIKEVNTPETPKGFFEQMESNNRKKPNKL